MTEVTKTAYAYEDDDYEDFLPTDIWTEVAPNLWQGGTDDEDTLGRSEFSYGSKPRITLKDFDTVVTLHALSNPVDWQVRELRFGFDDGQVGVDVFEKDLFFLAKFVDDELKAGKRVLVRCLAGLNRSGLVNALVLIRQGYTAELAIALIRSSRSKWALCNFNFEDWLLSINETNWRGDELIENK